MINDIHDPVILAARVFLAALFLIFGWRKVRDYPGTVAQMVRDGVPTPVLATLVAIFMELPVSFAVAIGAFTRSAAILMVFYTLGTSLIEHRYWTVMGPDRVDKLESFYKNLSIMGASCCWSSPAPGNIQSTHGWAAERHEDAKDGFLSGGVMDWLLAGIGWTGVAMTLNRVAVGAFFMLSGFHKLFNADRHRTVVDELKALGVPAVGFNQWWVPLVEFAAGAAVLIGLLAPLAALGLLVIIVVAIVTSGHRRMKLIKPIDEADRIDDFLYLPETLYAFMLILVVSAGAGPYSLDAVILGLINKVPN